MSDDVWRRAEIESPCQKICIVHPESRLCIGCLRSIDEIRDWSGLTTEGRAQILAELPDRAALVKGKRRGGRARSRK